MPFQLRLLRHNSSIYVGHLPTTLIELVPHRLQQLQAGDVLIPGVAGGEVAADISQHRRTEQGVDDGVDEGIAVAPTVQPPVVGYLHPTQHQPPPGGEGVDIVAYADTQLIFHVYPTAPRPESGHRGWLS